MIQNNRIILKLTSDLAFFLYNKKLCTKNRFLRRFFGRAVFNVWEKATPLWSSAQLKYFNVDDFLRFRGLFFAGVEISPRGRVVLFFVSFF